MPVFRNVKTQIQQLFSHFYGIWDVIKWLTDMALSRPTYHYGPNTNSPTHKIFTLNSVSISFSLGSVLKDFVCLHLLSHNAK